MNIVITLPSNLIEAIIAGKKTAELRKVWPKLFNPDTDVVYVIKKGTKNIVAWFKIRSFVKTTMYYDAWKWYGRKLNIDYLWYADYITPNKPIVFWMIEKAGRFKKSIDREKSLHLNKNPQQFFYTDTRLSDPQTAVQ